MPALRTLILSDLHLGRRRHGARSAARLRGLWRGFDRVILNGDVAEIHHPRHRQAAASEVVHLLDLCERDGIEPVILSGNHDPFISDLRRLVMMDGRVFITHGDVFHPAVAPWSPAAPRIEEANVLAYELLQRESASALEARLRASQLASHVEWLELEKQARRSSMRGMLLRPWAMVEVLRYWRAFPGIVVRFVQEHGIEARYIICGHTHRAGIWERGGRTIINTGSFGFPGRPLAVTLEESTLSVWKIENNSNGYALASEPMRNYSVMEPHPPASALKTREIGG